MPVARNYQGGSIVYFQGDMGDDIFVLQKGRVVLLTTSPETGDELREEVQLGEFFGVKSSLGHFTREETAQVVGGTTLIVFKAHEFEVYAQKNTRIIMKMLKVFSKQLRQIHRQVRDILKVGASRDPAYELMNVAESFYKGGSVDHAVYAFQKYLEYYPAGSYSARAKDLLTMARKGLIYPLTYPALMPVVESSKPRAPSSGHDPFAMNFDEEGGIQEGMELYNRGDYMGAKLTFAALVDHDGDTGAKALFEKGRCEMKLTDFDDATATFSAYLKNHPSGENMKEALYNLGLLAEVKQQRDRARALYHKVATMPPVDETTKEARKRMEKLG